MIVDIKQKYRAADSDNISPDMLFGGFFLYIFFFSYIIQHCFICRPSDSTVPTDAGIEPRTVATVAFGGYSSHPARNFIWKP
jgi:hypothetical protein